MSIDGKFSLPHVPPLPQHPPPHSRPSSTPTRGDANTNGTGGVSSRSAGAGEMADKKTRKGKQRTKKALATKSASFSSLTSSLQPDLEPLSPASQHQLQVRSSSPSDLPARLSTPKRTPRFAQGMRDAIALASSGIDMSDLTASVAVAEGGEWSAGEQDKVSRGGGDGGLPPNNASVVVLRARTPQTADEWLALAQKAEKSSQNLAAAKDLLDHARTVYPECEKIWLELIRVHSDSKDGIGPARLDSRLILALPGVFPEKCRKLVKGYILGFTPLELCCAAVANIPDSKKLLRLKQQHEAMDFA